MVNREKVIKALSCENRTSSFGCYNIDCPYNSIENCYSEQIMHDALELLKEQAAIIDQYHKADVFLKIHGWKWEGR